MFTFYVLQFPYDKLTNELLELLVITITWTMFCLILFLCIYSCPNTNRFYSLDLADFVCNVGSPIRDT